MVNKKRKPVYVAEPKYVFDELPGYLQKRYRNGHGFVEVRPGLTRESYSYRKQSVFGRTPTYDSYGKVWIDREEDGLFIPLTDYEERLMRRMDAQRTISEWWQAQLREAEEARQQRQRKMERRRKRDTNDYIHRYLHNTGLWNEAVKAGVGLWWIYLK